MYSKSKQLIKGAGDSSDFAEHEKYLNDVLDAYISLRSLPYPYYNWSSIVDKWNEYDRCYEVRAKDNRQAYEYAGYSNIVLPDFHEKIETIRTREMNVFFSGIDLFEVKENKYSKADDAYLAKKLVNYNFKTIPDFRMKVSNIEKDKLQYGTWIAYTPFVCDEIKERQILDFMIDENGLPIMVDGVIQRQEPYEAYIVREKKYTDAVYLNLKYVYIHPKIDDIQRQEAVFVLTKLNYTDLLDMEENEIIGEGMADYVKSNYSANQVDDEAVERGEEKRAGFTDDYEDKDIQVFDIYLCYYWYGEGKNRKRYEGLYIKNNKLLGLREWQRDKLPFIMGWHIKTEGAYGIGMSDEMYPAYIAKCARLNQVLDISTFEIKGGGFKDSSVLKGFERLEPGVWYDVPGLSAQLAASAKPIVSWNELRGSSKSAISGMEIVGYFNEAMQSGTGAVSLLSGMPTQSDIDKTVGGIKTTISESNTRINTYVEDFEDQFFKVLAERSYENYQEFLTPEDMANILDPEDFTYIDDQGNEKQISLPDTLPGVEFNFIAVKRVIESEKVIGKYQRFLGSLAQIMASVAPIIPDFAEAIVKSMDWKFIIGEIARNMEIADIDKIFPKVNLMSQLLDSAQENKRLEFENQNMAQGIQVALQKLEETGNQSALQVIREVMEGGMSSGQGQMPPTDRV